MLQPPRIVPQLAPQLWKLLLTAAAISFSSAFDALPAHADWNNNSTSNGNGNGSANKPFNNGFDYPGPVLAVDAQTSNLTLQTQDGPMKNGRNTARAVTFKIPATATVEVNGKPAKFEDIKVGMNAVLQKSGNSPVLSVRAWSANPRQQTNDLSAFLDGSMIYGSDSARAASLRTFSGGLLQTSAGDLPPLNTGGVSNANDAHFFPDNQLFLAGDVRANENIELSAVHVIWLREHNRIARAIAAQFPQLSDELIYQWTRQLVGAEVEEITYNEFLPAFLGTLAPGSYRGYDPGTNPGIANEFSGAAFRVGHTLINDDVEFLDNDGNPVREPLELSQAFFNPDPLHETGPAPMIKYLASDDTQEVDLKLVDSLRNFLFGPPGAGGFDLAARNTQRGRDHGLADFNTTRRAYGLPRVTSFSEITSDGALAAQLQALYGDVNDVDLWVGGLAETHAGGSSVGPTFGRIIANQFERTRSGDQFWYQNVFRGQALQILDSTRLSDVIKRNTDLTNLQENVFFYKAGTTSFTPNPNRTAPTIERLVQAAAPTLAGMKTFRSFDGGNNNRQNPSWGQAGVRLLRTAPAAYADGMAQPAGPNRPSARLISNAVSVQSDGTPANARFMSDWVYAWGQFVDHDLSLTSTGSETFDIAIPKGDPWFDPKSTGTMVMALDRSLFDPTTGTAGALTPEVPPHGGPHDGKKNPEPPRGRQPLHD